MRINPERLVATFQQLVAIDSRSYAERAMGDHLTQRLGELGLSVEEDEAGRIIGGNCGNLLARLPGDPSQEPVLFCAHMDTVEPASGKRAIVGADGVIRSDGTTVLGADDAAGLAAILEALQTLQTLGLPHRPVEILFTAAEEVYCKGIEAFDFTRLQAREAYVLDLTGPVGSAANAAPTILTFTVKIHGRSAHAGFAPHEGIHAIAAAAAGIHALRLGRIDHETTLNIGRVEGGRATNIVPDLCTVIGEVRSLSHEKAMLTAESVRGIFAAETAALGATAEFEPTVQAMAYETPLDHPVVARFEAACRQLELEPRLAPTFGGSDNNSLAQRGVRGIVLANAMNQCHSTEEFTTVDELARIAELTLTLMTT